MPMREGVLPGERNGENGGGGRALRGGNLLYDCRLGSESTAAELRQLLRERRPPPSLEAWLCVFLRAG